MASPAQLGSAWDVEKGSARSGLPPVYLRDDGESGRSEDAGRTSSDSEAVPKQGGALSSPWGERSRGQEGGDGGAMSRVVSRVLTRASTTKSNWNPGLPPDGGMKAWAVVASAHLVIMNTWGLVGSFGLFQTYYATALGRPPSDISWIGSLQIFLLFFVGTFAGRLTDAGYFRHVFATGVAFNILGIFCTSAATSYWQVVLAQGICLGFGNGCMFCPVMATLSTYFDKQRGLAIGMASCGTATGGLVFPSMMRQLLPSQGFAASVRAIGFVQVATFAVAALFLKPRIPPRKSGPLVEWAAFKEAAYAFYALGSFSFFLGLYFAFYYVASFSRDIIGMSYADSLNLLLVMNGVGIPGRLISNHLADRVGPLNVFIPVAGIGGACLFSWMAVESTASLYVWSCFYGLTAGGLTSLFPAGLTSLTTDLRKSGVRMGMVFTIVSFATLAGPPIAGAIITASGGGYRGAQGFAGATLLLGMAFMMAARKAAARTVTATPVDAGSRRFIKV
ncbi:hypothetical protein MFIFM68171_07170 [Madurella fahalii]|uniref:Uncharacterized protein n=1 Tax=Madurella fahalii TaxID=1157608 RepID=A0ABQ0GGZ8_9PEZI